MKKIYIILMVSAALLFTSIQNYSYSFDRNPMESGIDTEESDGENEDTPDAGVERDDKAGFRQKTVAVEAPSYGLFQSYDYIICCIYANRFTSCDFNTQADRIRCSRYRQNHPYTGEDE